MRRGGSRLRGQLLLALLVGCAALGATADRAGALTLEQRCIASGLVPPQEMRGFFFNHHPEKDRDVRATDNFLAPAEIAAEVEAIVADLPAACRGQFSRRGLIKLQFKASQGGKRWRSIYKGGEEIHWGQRYLDPPKADPVERRHTTTVEGPSFPSSVEYEVEEEPSFREESTTVTYEPADDLLPSPFVSIRTQQNIGSLGLGCATAGRAQIKMEIVDDTTKAIVAVRLLRIPIPVDSWFRARCAGKFSIQDSAAAKRCGKRVVGGAPGRPPTLWGVKVQRVGCGVAAAVGQKALQVPEYSQGSLSSHRVEGWRCFFGHRGSAACLKGRSRVFLVARKGVGERCGGALRGIRKLSAAGTACETASAVASQIQQDPNKELFVQRQLGGATWACSALRYLDSDDRLIMDYHCFSGAAMVAFEVPAFKGRVVPVEPTSIAPEVILPGSGPAELFLLTPELKFGERAKWTKNKAFLPIEVEPALVGQKARLELVEFEAECTWTADEGQTDPICPTSKRVGASTRSIVLEPTQLVYFIPRKHRGNWLYRLTVKTRPFTYNGLSYRRTSHVATASVINEAKNCKVNPWCDNDKGKK
jgi:hypothetical protein